MRGISEEIEDARYSWNAGEVSLEIRRHGVGGTGYVRLVDQRLQHTPLSAAGIINKCYNQGSLEGAHGKGFQAI